MEDDLKCPHCGVTPDNLYIGDLPLAGGQIRETWEWTHLRGCPSYVDPDAPGVVHVDPEIGGL